MRARRTRRPSDERTYICVPLQQSKKPRGVLEVELAFRSDRNYDRTMKFYGVVGSMLAQALKMQQLLAADRQRLVDENMRLRDELRERYDFSHILGNSGAMRQVCEQVVKVARTNTTVLIRGESGTGKELIAQAIHYNSLRARKAFVKVSCAALPDTLIESELFGYEKGAFTGAEQRKKGRFELADGGTLLLDEIGDVNLATQVKLLRVLQEREFERLGGTDVGQGRRPADRRDQQRPRGGGRRRHAAPGSALPAQRLHDLRAAAARAEVGHPAARRSLRREARRPSRASR